MLSKYRSHTPSSHSPRRSHCSAHCQFLPLPHTPPRARSRCSAATRRLQQHGRHLGYSSMRDTYIPRARRRCSAARPSRIIASARATLRLQQHERHLHHKSMRDTYITRA